MIIKAGVGGGGGARGERAQEERKDKGERWSRTKVEVILMCKELAEERG